MAGPRVGYRMGHASPGNPEIPLAWYVAAIAIVLSLAALCARVV